MPQLIISVPPSKTAQTITVEYSIPDPQAIFDKPVITGTTPIDSTPTPVPEPPVSGWKEIYRNDFNEPGDLDPFKTGQAGNGFIEAGQFRSRPKDGVSGGTRSEIQLKLAIPNEFRVEYDVTYNYICQNDCHTLQFHPETKGGSASPGLWHEGGKFVWKNWKGGDNTRYPTFVTIPRGKRMHMIIEGKFGTNGYLKHTIDGNVVLDKQNIQVGDGTATTFKLGYNGGWGGVMEALKSDILYDNLVIYGKV